MLFIFYCNEKNTKSVSQDFCLFVLDLQWRWGQASMHRHTSHEASSLQVDNETGGGRDEGRGRSHETGSPSLLLPPRSLVMWRKQSSLPPSAQLVPQASLSHTRLCHQTDQHPPSPAATSTHFPQETLHRVSGLPSLVRSLRFLPAVLHLGSATV